MILTWRHTADAVKSMQAFNDYVSEVEKVPATPAKPIQGRPFTILFTYRIEEKFAASGFLELLAYDPEPFDLIVVLGKGAYFASGYVEMAHAFQRKLTVGEAREDMYAAYAMVAHDVAFLKRKYVRAAMGPDDTLMALIYALTEQCAGSDLTATLSAKGSVIPFELSQSNQLDNAVPLIVPNTCGPQP